REGRGLGDELATAAFAIDRKDLSISGARTGGRALKARRCVVELAECEVKERYRVGEERAAESGQREIRVDIFKRAAKAVDARRARGHNGCTAQVGLGSDWGHQWV